MEVATLVASIAASAASAASARKAEKGAERRSKRMERLLSTPAPPLPKLEEPGGADLGAWLRRRKGRAATVLTGDLVPMDLGQRTLLG